MPLRKLEIHKDSNDFIRPVDGNTGSLENLEMCERMRVPSFIIYPMLISLTTFLATLSSTLRSRAALRLLATKSACFRGPLQNTRS
jgi:hypothetical protein